MSGPLALRRLGPRAVLAFGSRTILAFRPPVALRIAALVAAILIVSAIVLTQGTFGLTASEVWSTLFHPSGATGEQRLIVWEFRVPRILLGIAVGAMLAVAGACLQSMTRNGLADPGLIGVTEGATVAILLNVVFQTGIAPTWYPLMGMAGGALVALMVLTLTRRLSGVKFILIGIGVSALLGAAISLFVTYGNINAVQSALVWMAGSLSPASWDILLRTLPWTAGGLAAAIALTRPTDAVLLGPLSALALGVRVQRVGFLLVVTSVVLTSASVAAVGTLGFVGLIGPHLARFLVGTSQSALVAGSALCGALLVLLADSLGRLVFAPLQIPAGIVMALIGVPFFLILLWKRRNAL